MIILSICIPTFNRAAHLRNCLSSLIQCGLSKLSEVQICISDNCSTDTTKQVVVEAEKVLTIKYQANQSNVGIARNFLEVVQMADGEFVWMLGDDDLLMPGACERIIDLIYTHAQVDYFYVNANHLNTEYVQNFPKPFNLKNLPKNMQPFSSWEESGEMPFLKLIDPKVSYDFLGGIFLSVFRRSMWSSHVGCLDKHALADYRLFSHFDNTFPHVKVFANAYSNSLAYFSPEPASVCLTGAREWAPMFSMIMSIRIIEALEWYRKSGLSFLQYLKCRNYALRGFVPQMGWILLHPKVSGLRYVKVNKSMLSNLIYPNVYLSLVYYGVSKLGVLMSRFNIFAPKQ